MSAPESDDTQKFSIAELLAPWLAKLTSDETSQIGHAMDDGEISRRILVELIKEQIPK